MHVLLCLGKTADSLRIIKIYCGICKKRRTYGGHAFKRYVGDIFSVLFRSQFIQYFFLPHLYTHLIQFFFLILMWKKLASILNSSMLGKKLLGIELLIPIKWGRRDSLSAPRASNTFVCFMMKYDVAYTIWENRIKPWSTHALLTWASQRRQKKTSIN